MNDMKASNLSFRYKNGDKLILKDISVDIPAGEFVCLSWTVWMWKEYIFKTFGGAGGTYIWNN